MNNNVKNIFTGVPGKLDEEFFEDILNTDDFRVERIVSQAHASPKDFFYDQDENEFVLLLRGSAQISFESGSPIIMKPGDHIVISAHQKHRVDWTDSNEQTFWLTIFYK